MIEKVTKLIMQTVRIKIMFKSFDSFSLCAPEDPSFNLKLLF